MSDKALDFVRQTQLPTRDDLAEMLDRIAAARAMADGQDDGSLAADNTKSGSVNAGSLTSFTEKLSGQGKSDVQNSTLFAQLAANYDYDKFTDPMKWYLRYTEVLGQIGWINPAFAFKAYNSEKSTFTMNEAVLDILAAIATANEVAIVAATMDGLKSLSDDSKQIAVWDSNSNNGSNGTFQIFPVDQLPNGDVVMVLAGLQFTANKVTSRFLWFEWSKTSVKIEQAAGKFVLNDDVYKTVRKEIVERLGDLAKDLVLNIPLKFPS
ncbi:MAG: hypothetical protein U0Q21_04475 [Dermatophilaceae bacterium]|uniref:hypothetical protein n=1 Tax=Nostocoides sp. TaxID=1917966 RepID=UPI002BA015D2|nr:hypothetical protein [Tetrasphaera sp.]HNQ07235.1 hypothetical protein [Tetrasphaera sp.]